MNLEFDKFNVVGQFNVRKIYSYIKENGNV